jgi:hypothetical protein
VASATMGQYWQYVNLDKRQTYGNWGKLGELLFVIPKSVAQALQRVSVRVLPLPPKSDGSQADA